MCSERDGGKIKKESRRNWEMKNGKWIVKDVYSNDVCANCVQNSNQDIKIVENLLRKQFSN